MGLRFHTGFGALLHPTTWAGLSALAGTTATQLPDPHKTHLTYVAFGCGALATILKQPTETVDTPVKGSTIKPTETVSQ